MIEKQTNEKKVLGRTVCDKCGTTVYRDGETMKFICPKCGREIKPSTRGWR
ncbi:MAG: hypothetical protein Q8L10_04350 [Candidatus Moranbacteria bacterium]|nr:hypothetical protein [Candidatus Moranbacteria bacterium]